MAVATLGLYKLIYKINAPYGGTTVKLYVKSEVPADVVAIGSRLATRIKRIMPTDSEIFFATANYYDKKRDSLFLETALGAGSYVIAGTPPVQTVTDQRRTALLLRREHTGGNPVSLKFAPVPDDRVARGVLVDPIPPCLAVPGAPVATAAAATWVLEWKNLLDDLVLSTHHVSAGYVPGGKFNWFNWTRAFVLRIADKKGGRGFDS